MYAQTNEDSISVALEDSIRVSSEDLIESYQTNQNFSSYYGFPLPKEIQEDSIAGSEGLNRRIPLSLFNPRFWIYATFFTYLQNMYEYTTRGIIEGAIKNEESNLEILKSANAGINSNLSGDYKIFFNVPKAFAKYNLRDLKGAYEDVNAFIDYAEANFKNKIRNPAYSFETENQCYLWRAYFLRIFIAHSLNNWNSLQQDCNTLLSVKSHEEKKKNILPQNIQRNEMFYYLLGIAKANLGKSNEACGDLRKAIHLGNKNALEAFKELQCK